MPLVYSRDERLDDIEEIDCLEVAEVECMYTFKAKMVKMELWMLRLDVIVM